MHEWIAYICLCTTFMPGVQGDQKREMNPLELVLQMILSLHASARKQA